MPYTFENDIVTFSPALNITYLAKHQSSISELKFTPRGFVGTFNLDGKKHFTHLAEDVKVNMIQFTDDESKKCFIKAMKEAKSNGLKLDPLVYTFH